MFKILLDLDCTLNNLLWNWLTIYNYRYNDNATVGDVREWDHYKYTKASEADFGDILGTPGLFRGLNPLPGAVEYVNRLQDYGHDVYIVTACDIKYPDVIVQKMEWMMKHFPNIDKRHFITAHNKYLINGDILDDDGPHNAELYKKHHPKAKTITTQFEYNKDNVYYDFIAPSWKDPKTAFELKYQFIQKCWWNSSYYGRTV